MANPSVPTKKCKAKKNGASPQPAPKKRAVKNCPEILAQKAVANARALARSGEQRGRSQ